MTDLASLAGLIAPVLQGAVQGVIGAVEYNVPAYFAERAADPSAVETYDYTKAVKTVLVGAAGGGVAGALGLPSPQDGATLIAQSQYFTVFTFLVDRASKGIARHLKAAILKASGVKPAA